jgi:signal transduction histidine kinase
LGLHAISFVFQAWFQGGLESPAIASMFLLPAVAMLVIGKKGALCWFAIALFWIIVFFIYEQTFDPIVPQYDLSKKSFFYFGSILGSTVVIFFILLVYENGKNESLLEVQQKHKDLKNTQKQLIQTEKLASLGELTAGIAHEIQNPLNFVINFAELSDEMLMELRDELSKDIEERNSSLMDNIIDDLSSNLKKITHHGQRASDIVKGMLELTRKNTGTKELVNLNELTDEYLRLAFHGLRAKSKDFNADFESILDPKLPKINAVRQDIGRVLLNLINNAFYAVFEQKIKEGSSYMPKVTVTTILEKGNAQIIIKDNGSGISEEIKNKIFQPFFTTKPSGNGTGLGLSLAYDIIVKGHNGEIKFNSEINEGSSFIISFPI